MRIPLNSGTHVEQTQSLICDQMQNTTFFDIILDNCSLSESFRNFKRKKYSWIFLENAGNGIGQLDHWFAKHNQNRGHGLVQIFKKI